MNAERVAGTDTREVMTTRTIRAVVAASALVAGPGWVAAFATPAAWRRSIAMPNGAGPWVAIGLVFAGIGAGIIAWRAGPMQPQPQDAPKRMPPALGSLLLVGSVAVYAAAARDTTIAAAILPAMALVAGWFVGNAARLAASTCVPDVRSAACGVVIAGALVGLIIAGHIALVAKGSGILRACGWGAAYLAMGSLNLARARRAWPEDLRKTTARIAAQHAAAIADAARAAGSALPALRLDGIVVSFGVNRILEHATLEVRRGELVALVGRNGAGKSTLLRVAAGLINPDEGRIVVGDDEVTTLLPEERAAAGLAFVSGARPIFPDLTVIENLRVAAYRSHLTARTFDPATEEIFSFVPALAGRRKARAGVLSGGEQRLLAVAQSLYRRPLVLLADELSLGLDIDARTAVISLLRILADEGVAVVVVDHDLPTLLPRADRAALLAGGAVQIYDDPAELLTKRADLLPATFLAGVSG